MQCLHSDNSGRNMPFKPTLKHTPAVFLISLSILVPITWVLGGSVVLKICIWNTLSVTLFFCTHKKVNLKIVKACKVYAKSNIIPTCFILTDFQFNLGLVLVLFLKWLRSWESEKCKLIRTFDSLTTFPLSQKQT